VVDSPHRPPAPGPAAQPLGSWRGGAAGAVFWTRWDRPPLFLFTPLTRHAVFSGLSYSFIGSFIRRRDFPLVGFALLFDG